MIFNPKKFGMLLNYFIKFVINFLNYLFINDNYRLLYFYQLTPVLLY